MKGKGSYHVRGVACGAHVSRSNNLASPELRTRVQEAQMLTATGPPVLLPSKQQGSSNLPCPALRHPRKKYVREGGCCILAGSAACTATTRQILASQSSFRRGPNHWERFRARARAWLGLEQWLCIGQCELKLCVRVGVINKHSARRQLWSAPTSGVSSMHRSSACIATPRK